MEENIEHYIQNLREAFLVQRAAAEFTDIQFVLHDGTTRAHKMILSCSNNFWNTVLRDDDQRDGQVTVIIPEESLADVTEWLEKVYSSGSFNSTKSSKKSRKITQALESGKSTKTSKFKQTCQQCQKVFLNYKTYLSHCWSHRPEKWKISCEECPKLLFQTKRHLMIHQSKVHGKQKKCPHCSKTLSTDANLREHIRNLHSIDAKYTCEQCGKIFSAKPYLRAHQKIHNAETRCMKKCPVCNKVVSSRHYSQHLRYHDPSTWKHNCQLCNEKFMTLYKLYEHESITHTGQPRFKCPHCEELFHTTARRAFHKKTCLGVIK